MAKEGVSYELYKLWREARKSCELRSHVMQNPEWTDEYSGMSECKICGRSVVVRTNPMPNQVNISGEAVAINCDSWEQK